MQPELAVEEVGTVPSEQHISTAIKNYLSKENIMSKVNHPAHRLIAETCCLATAQNLDAGDP